MRVLNLQNLQFLQKTRQELLLKNPSYFSNLSILNAKPNPQDSPLTGKELASIHRSDLILTSSDYEEFILKSMYNINHTALITFFHMEVKNKENYERLKNFDFRRHYLWLGNINNPQNLDSLDVLVKEIWPRLSERLPKAELHIYGENIRKEIYGEGKGIKIMVFCLIFQFFQVF